MSTMVERVARAIERTYVDFADPTPAQRAQAAIEAMHEPTEEMIVTGLEAYEECLPKGAARDAQAERALVRDIFIAMASTAYSQEYSF